MDGNRFIEEIGSAPKIFAYPYGVYNLEVLNQVKLHVIERNPLGKTTKPPPYNNLIKSY